MGSDPHLFRFAGAHDRFRPAFDLAIEATAASDVNAEAAVVVLADVFPNRLRIVALISHRRSRDSDIFGGGGPADPGPWLAVG